MYGYFQQTQVLIENMKKISLNKNDVKKLYEEGKSIFYPNDVMDKSQVLIQVLTYIYNIHVYNVYISK